jgi:hypothetical protein
LILKENSGYNNNLANVHYIESAGNGYIMCTTESSTPYTDVFCRSQNDVSRFFAQTPISVGGASNIFTSAKGHHKWRTNQNLNMFISATGGIVRFFPRTTDPSGFGVPVVCNIENGISVSKIFDKNIKI